MKKPLRTMDLSMERGKAVYHTVYFLKKLQTLVSMSPKHIKIFSFDINLTCSGSPERDLKSG